jgi:hypothetical protein
MLSIHQAGLKPIPSPLKVSMGPMDDQATATRVDSDLFLSVTLSGFKWVTFCIVHNQSPTIECEPKN